MSLILTSHEETIACLGLSSIIYQKKQIECVKRLCAELSVFMSQKLWIKL